VPEALHGVESVPLTALSPAHHSQSAGYDELGKSLSCQISQRNRRGKRADSHRSMLDCWEATPVPPQINNRGEITGWYLPAPGTRNGYALRDGVVTTIDYPGSTHASERGQPVSGGTPFVAAEN
jgi:hypothetical protein